jgi:hypothetical protein
LNQKDDSSLRQQGGELPPLDTPNSPVVRGNHEGRNREDRPQLFDVLRIAAENGPTDAFFGGGACHMWKCGRASWLKDNHLGTGFGCGLDVVEQLLTLQDAIILCEYNFEIRPNPGGRFASGPHLFDLEIVAVVQYREQEPRPGHKRSKDSTE